MCQIIVWTQIPAPALFHHISLFTKIPKKITIEAPDRVLSDILVKPYIFLYTLIWETQVMQEMQDVMLCVFDHDVHIVYFQFAQTLFDKATLTLEAWSPTKKVRDHSDH